ncbi:low-density lipoprotein receptor-related protein 12-like [Amphiura filiformis]|uniref:low-density lipoprotein receptor-related protein 12-like n=1 Tax=Amphiura filiformis TaxID=82378 RepID=UPI003B21B7C4
MAPRHSLIYALGIMIGFLTGKIKTSETQECANQTNLDLQIGYTINISSPSFPNFYPDDVDCTWIISSHLDGSFFVLFHEVILLRVTRYVDYLMLGTGASFREQNQLLELTTFASPGASVIVEHFNIWIRFLAGNKYRNTGFSLDVERTSFSVPCHVEPIACDTGSGCVAENAFICTDLDCFVLTDMNECDHCGDNDLWCESGFGCYDKKYRCDNKFHCFDGSDEFNCHSCGAERVNLYNGDVMYLTTPNYPDIHPHNLICTWYIHSSLNISGSFFGRFIDFDLDEFDDYLYIGLGDEVSPNTTVIRLNWHHAPNSFSISDDVMWVQFVSNELEAYSGFFMRLERIPDNTGKLKPYDPPYDHVSKCTVALPCTFVILLRAFPHKCTCIYFILSYESRSNVSFVYAKCLFLKLYFVKLYFARYLADSGRRGSKENEPVGKIARDSSRASDLLF